MPVENRLYENHKTKACGGENRGAAAVNICSGPSVFTNLLSFIKKSFVFQLTQRKSVSVFSTER